MIGYIRFRYGGRRAGTRGKEVTHLAEAGTKVLGQRKEPVMVWEWSGNNIGR